MGAKEGRQMQETQWQREITGSRVRGIQMKGDGDEEIEIIWVYTPSLDQETIEKRWPADQATRRQGYTETWRQGHLGIRRPADKETRRQGNKETREPINGTSIQKGWEGFPTTCHSPLILLPPLSLYTFLSFSLIYHFTPLPHPPHPPLQWYPSALH